MSLFPNSKPAHQILTERARAKLNARLAGDMRALMEKRAIGVVTKALAPTPAALPEGVMATSLEGLFDMITKAFDDMKEDAEKYVTNGQPGYTGIYDRDVKPIDFNRFMELMRIDDYNCVGLTKLTTPDGEEIRISTVWVGMDFSGLKGAPPLIYESMVFGGKGDGRADRYTTTNQAQAGHSKLVEWVRQMDGAS